MAKFEPGEAINKSLKRLAKHRKHYKEHLKHEKHEKHMKHRKAIKTTGKFEGKSNRLGQGGRAAQLKAQGVPGGVIGNLARAAHAAPGQKNFHKHHKSEHLKMHKHHMKMHKHYKALTDDEADGKMKAHYKQMAEHHKTVAVHHHKMSSCA